MKVAICGTTGFVGSALVRYLQGSGIEVVGVGRSDLKLGHHRIQELLFDSDAVINLAGAPILKRWTSAWKEEIWSSRIVTTRTLVSAINAMSRPPRLFISSSAVGIYDDQHLHDEFSQNLSTGFLGQVCNHWEAEALKVDPGVRLCIFRLGVVLSAEGGALKRMVFPFKAGVGGTIGQGNQPFPFIHLLDVLRFYQWALENTETVGIYNLVAPQLVTNREFTLALARKVHRKAFLRIPAMLLKLVFGAASQTLIAGQRVKPVKALETGFEFELPTLTQALDYDFQKA